MRRLDTEEPKDVTEEEDSLTVEEPLSISVAGDVAVTTMRTPGHDRELAMGFLLSEGLVRDISDIGSIAHCGRPGDEGYGNTIEITVAAGTVLDLDRIDTARRGTLVTSSCGVCGRRTIADLLERSGRLPDGPQLLPGLVTSAVAALGNSQPMFRETGGLHAAGLFDADGVALGVFEDIGRHNAVDKVIGALLLSRTLGRAVLLCVTGRVSFEIVQKAVAARIPIVASVSAPSSLAVDLAVACNVTLAAFVRGPRLSVYSRHERLQAPLAMLPRLAEASRRSPKTLRSGARATLRLHRRPRGTAPTSVGAVGTEGACLEFMKALFRLGDPPKPLPERRSEGAFDDHPFLAIWELTQACDLVCAHCRACATPHRAPDELDTTEGKHLLDRIAAMGTKLVVLTGGDPAKRPDLVELVRHGASAGLLMAVTPSGTGLTTRELLEQLKEAGLSRLAVSVDGPDAATHDAFRGVAGSFDDSVRILQTAREIGLSTQVNTSLHPGNIGDLGKMADFVARMGSVLWGVFAIVPTGRATLSLLMGPKRLEAALEQLADIATSAPFDVKTTAAPHFRRVLMARHAERPALGVLRDTDADGIVRGPRGITDGVGFLFVSHRGEVFPSGFLPVSAGNVRAADVAEIYRDSPLFRDLRDLDKLTGKCGVCPFKRVCGGSRARAYAMTGDALGEDPLCAYVPRGWGSSETLGGAGASS